jgi:hypothetical protein
VAVTYAATRSVDADFGLGTHVATGAGHIAPAVFADVAAGVDPRLAGVALGRITDLGVYIAVKRPSDLILAALRASRGQQANQEADSQDDSHGID